jgi:hypothetical protein
MTIPQRLDDEPGIQSQEHLSADPGNNAGSIPAG